MGVLLAGDAVGAYIVSDMLEYCEGYSAGSSVCDGVPTESDGTRKVGTTELIECESSELLGRDEGMLVPGDIVEAPTTVAMSSGSTCTRCESVGENVGDIVAASLLPSEPISAGCDVSMDVLLVAGENVGAIVAVDTVQ